MLVLVWLTFSTQSIGISAAPKFREPIRSPAKKIAPSSHLKYEEEEGESGKTWDEDQELDDLIGLDD